MHKKTVLLSVVLFLGCCGVSYAGALLQEEAIRYFNEGVRAQNAGDYQAADSAYQKALILNNSDHWRKLISNNYGVIYAQQGDLKRAEAAFNEALRMDPDYRIPKLNLGLIYDKRADRLKAIEFWLQALNINLDELKPKQFVVQEYNEPPSPVPYNQQP